MTRKKSNIGNKAVLRRGTLFGTIEIGDVKYPRLHDKKRRELDDIAATRPKMRGECPKSRPCPWVGCEHHLYLDVPSSGAIVVHNPDIQPWEMKQCCALDIAENEGITLDEIGVMFDVSRERIRQIEERSIEKLGKRAPDIIGTFEDTEIDELEELRLKREEGIGSHWGQGKIKKTGAFREQVREAVREKVDNGKSTKFNEGYRRPPRPVKKPLDVPDGWSAKTHTASVETRETAIQPTQEQVDDQEAKTEKEITMNKKKESKRSELAEKLERAKDLQERIKVAQNLERQAKTELEPLITELAGDELIQSIFQISVSRQTSPSPPSPPPSTEQQREESLPEEVPVQQTGPEKEWKTYNHEGKSYRQRLIDWAMDNPGREARPVEIADETGVPKKSITAHISHVKGEHFEKVGDGIWRSMHLEDS